MATPHSGVEAATPSSRSTSILGRTAGQVMQQVQNLQQQTQNLQVPPSQTLPQSQQQYQQQQPEKEAMSQISGATTGDDSNQISTGIPSIRKEKGSTQRKRSRVHEETGNRFVKEGMSQKEWQGQGSKLDDFMQQLYDQVEMVFAKGERGKTMFNKQIIFDTLRVFGMEIFRMIMTVNNLQDEKSALQHQVIQLMAQTTNNVNFPVLSAQGTPATTTYLQAAMTKSVSNNINLGKRLPLPDIPSSLQHAPSERVIIFKSDKKGTQLTKTQKEQFREDVNRVIGENLMEEVDVIRPTRNGGHTIIFQSEQSRAKALQAFRENEINAHISEDKSCIVAPKKKFAKVVCRDPPDDVSMDSILNDFYSKVNIHLHQIPRLHRETRIFDTRFGWIFEMSSVEAAAIQAQLGRIRYGHAKEIRVEEYIPLQQCYRCCLFGHNAKDCTSEQEYCRLCGEMGHMGWDCPIKDEKGKWKCANCLINNMTKGFNLPTNHAAAQLHKCPCALNQKEIKKAQLAAAGIYTSPIIEEHINIFMEPTNAMGQRNGDKAQNNNINGGAGFKRKGKSRSRSIRRNVQSGNTLSTFVRTPNNNNNNTPMYISSSSTTVSSTSSSSTTYDKTHKVMGGQGSQYGNRMMRVPRPKSYDGWKTVGAQSTPIQIDEMRGRDFHYSEGTNSMSNIMMLTPETMRPSGEVCQNGDERK